MEERNPFHTEEDEDLTPAFLQKKKNIPRAARRMPTGNRPSESGASPAKQTRPESKQTPLPPPAEASAKESRAPRPQPRRRPTAPAERSAPVPPQMGNPTPKKAASDGRAAPTAVRRRTEKPAATPPVRIADEPGQGNQSPPVAVRRQGQSKAVTPTPPPIPEPRKESQRREMPPPVYSTDEDEPERNRRNARRGETPLRRVTRLACLLFLGTVAFFLIRGALFLWMPVRSVTVEGVLPEWGYSESEILDATGLDTSMQLKDVSEVDVAGKLSAAFPYLCGATVTKTLLGEVTVTVRYETPAYLFSYEDTDYVLSETLKVLAVAQGNEPIPRLMLSRVSGCEVGRTIAFLGEYDFAFVCENAKKLTALFAGYSIDRIGMESKYDLYLVCESKYKLLFGDQENLEKKAALAQKTLLDPTFAREGQAVIDVTSGTKASVKFTDIGN